MTSVTVAKALKLKNRRAQRIGELQSRIQAYNSYVVGSDPEFDVVTLMEELRQEKAKLWRLKAAVARVNTTVSEAIYEIAEHKGMVAFLRDLNTQRGRTPRPYMGEAVEYTAQITAAQAGEEIKRLESLIDEIQDRLDTFNATTRIDVEE